MLQKTRRDRFRFWKQFKKLRNKKNRVYPFKMVKKLQIYSYINKEEEQTGISDKMEDQ